MRNLATESVLSERPAAPLGCGADAAAPVDRNLHASFEAIRRDWDVFSRYRLTLSRDGDWNDVTVVAEWLPYSEAVALREELSEELLAAQGGSRRWAQAAYSMSLHTPRLVKTDFAAVGDLLLHEQLEAEKASITSAGKPCG